MFRKIVSKKILEGAFLLFLSGIALWFFIGAGYSLYRYQRLNTPIKAFITKWEIEKRSDDIFLIYANFSFEYKGQVQEGKSAFGSGYPNKFAAENAIEKKPTEVFLQGWVDPHHLDGAVLAKAFPWKKTISAGILLLLLGYFFCLVLYVGKKSWRENG